MLSKTAVKYIQSLSFKKFRDENDVFVAEGPKIVEEIIADGTCRVKEIYALEEYAVSKAEWLKDHSINILIVSEIELEKISSLKTPNKVVALVSKKQSPPIKNINDQITLLLDGINDPGNMGTIIRIADWFGIENIICSENSVDCYNSKVVQSSMASIARVNMVYTDLERFIDQFPLMPTYAAVLEGQNIYRIEKTKSCFIIIGNESNGINDALLKLVKNKISIPRIGHAESLNAAVATGIILSSFKA